MMLCFFFFRGGGFGVVVCVFSFSFKCIFLGGTLDVDADLILIGVMVGILENAVFFLSVLLHCY